jgi:sulfur-oxidizing protein SoxY
LFIPADFVRTVEVSYAGRPVLAAQVDFSISENPNFRFYFVPSEAGDLQARVVDTKDREVGASARVELVE